MESLLSAAVAVKVIAAGAVYEVCPSDNITVGAVVGENLTRKASSDPWNWRWSAHCSW